MLVRTLAGACALGVVLLGGAASAQDQGPLHGFSMQGRLASSVATTLLTDSSAVAASLPVATPGFASLGWRGAWGALMVSPNFGTVSVREHDSIKLFGVTLHAEVVATRVLQGRGEGYALFGFGPNFIASDEVYVGYSVFLGLGARYWVSPAFAVNVELGEGYLSVPVTTSRSTAVLNTFGAMGVTLVLGSSDAAR